MPSNIIAYEWPLNGTAHIAYETGDNHIHEMVLGKKGTWRDNDITRAASSPELENAILAGFSWSDGHTQQIAYTSTMDASGHIYELVMYQDHPWSVEDIMRQAIDAAPADGFALVGYDWKAAGTKHLVYSGRDGHLHELSAGTRGLWKYSDLTQVTGAPLAENSLLAAFAWETGKQRQVVYVSGDGHIHELMSGMDGAWKHMDLTTVTGAPLAGDSALTAYAWEAGGTKQVVYIGDDGDVYELVCGQNAVWTFTDLTALTGAPLAAGSALAASAWETGRAKYVAYVGSNNHIYELQMPLQGTWEHTDLTQLLSAPEASEDDVAAHEWTPEFAKHMVYLDTAENPHIHSLMLKHGRQWQHTDVTGLTGSQSMV
jgi:hypothetical protein